MPSIETNTLQAVKARVATLPMKATYPIKWVTENYEPSPSQPFLRVTWMPNTNTRLFVGSTAALLRPSILQLDVMAKKSVGDDVAREIAGQVAAHFPPDLAMDFSGVRARVVKSTVERSFVDKHIQVPVTVEIQSFA